MRESTGSETGFGAQPSDWTRFAVALGLTQDLLPVVSNPNAAISPKSSLKALGKVPSLYNGDGRAKGIPRWTEYKATDKDITAWSKNPDYGICIQTRRVRALDGDITDANLSKEIRAAIQDFFASRGQRHPPVRTRGNSTKFLFAFTLSGTFSKRVIKTPHGNIEFLADGQQFIAAGTHPSGDRYTWDFGSAGSFPDMAGSDFEDLWQGLDAAFGVDPGASFPGEYTPRQRGSDLGLDDDLADWLYAKGRVLATKPDRSLVIECPWADEHTGGEAGDTSTVYFPAGTGGYELGHFKCLHAHCLGDARDRDFRIKIGYYEKEFDDITGEFPEEKELPTDQLKFPITWAAELKDEKPLEWIIKDVLPAAELAVVYGASGSGKTFMVLDMAAAIAQGEPWRGHKTRQANVLYVAAEGREGFKGRIRAYLMAHGLKTLKLAATRGAPNLMDPKECKEIIKSAKAAEAKIVVIDTLARTLHGNENSAEDMGKFVRSCAALHRSTGALVVVIHHSGKDETKGARGSSVLQAATDVEFQVRRFGDDFDCDRAFIVTKQKDGSDGEELAFKLESMPIGMDEDGDVVTSCVVAHLAQAKRKEKRRRAPTGQHERNIVKVLTDQVSQDGLVVADLISRLAGEIPVTSGRDRRKEVIGRAINKLENEGFVVVEQGKIRLAEEK